MVIMFTKMMDIFQSNMLLIVKCFIRGTGYELKYSEQLVTNSRKDFQVLLSNNSKIDLKFGKYCL